MSTGVTALGRVAHLLAATDETAGTVRAVADEGRRVFGAQRVGLYLLDERGDAMHVMVAIGLGAAYIETLRQRFRESLSASAALRGQAYFTPDARADKNSPIHEAVLTEGFRAVAALPLNYGGRVIGWLAFYHDTVRRYSEEERTLALAFADQAALAIGMRRLLDTVVRIKTEWQSAFDGIGTGLALVDAEGRIERANRFVAGLARVAVTELPGRSLAPMFVDWPAAGADPLSEAGRHGHRVTTVLVTLEGRHMALTATPRPDSGFVVALDDLTHYVRLEARYTRLVETAHDAIILAGPDGRVVSANPAAAALFGVPALRLNDQQLTELLPDEREPALSGREARRYESLVRRADGVHIAEVSLAPLMERGTPAGTVAVVRDVTRERLATEALRRSERRFRTLFHRAPLAIVTLDRDGNFLSANRAALKLAGQTGPTPGTSLQVFLPPATWPVVAGALQRSFEGETQNLDFHFRRRDGAMRQVTAVAVPVEERGGHRAILAIARDVTDEVQLRERLSHSEKMAALGGLVSGVAHELNNPLAGIAATAQACQLEGTATPDLARALETVRHEAMRAARIVTDLLTFARQRPLQRRDTHLNVIVRDTFAATPALAQQGAIWTLGLDPTLPAVSGDPDQIRQVITNLLVNAGQAMEPGPRREAAVRTWWDTEWVGFEVLDSGPGIPAESLSRVFEPFFTTKAQGRGTGLGLSISHGILRAHGGEISGENRPEGGARFAFRLPRDPTRIGRPADA